MVRTLSPADKHAVADAIAAAERATSAEIVAVVSPASDAYQGAIQLYGLALGSLIAAGLWAANAITAFPWLLTVQLGGMALLSFIPCLRRLCLQWVPKRIRHQRAAHRAFEEYMIVSRHLPASAPIALFYVSLAERYAHILPSRAVREKIPDADWNSVIDAFTTSMKSNNLQDACIATIQRMTALLEKPFPPERK